MEPEAERRKPVPLELNCSRGSQDASVSLCSLLLVQGCIVFNMEQVSDDELDHGAEEDSDKEDQDLDKMFGAWLGELDKLTQSLDDGKPQKPLQKPPLRQETNMANFSYRFSMYNINEALNQGDTVDLDALMADLCSIEQELNTISKPNSASRGQKKGQQRAPGGRSASTKHTGTSGGGSSGGSSSSSTRASPANTVRGGSVNSRPTASNISLDDITSQLEKASLSMDEAARQTSSSSSSSSSSFSSTTLRRPLSGSSGGGQHRRTGSVGTVSEREAPSQRSSVNSACASASSMDSLDIDKVMTGGEVEGQSSLSNQGQNQTSTEHSYLDRETSLILKSIAGKPSHLLTKRMGEREPRSPGLTHFLPRKSEYRMSAARQKSLIQFGSGVAECESGRENACGIRIRLMSNKK
ncbi:hypothetical protein FQN60_006928 [Etheostoma spectabile]|uniref:Ras-associating domain-containing protein n=1 Tax=Etheostoma spectabile TaxID=54343 RepID=A0A5J5CFM4_9PERO|nr:hypothetical protein FQN60_006928 [Etheostoma spectabile]